MRCGVWEPVGEVALEAVQIRPGCSVADVAVGSDEVVRRLLHPQPRDRLRRCRVGRRARLAGQVLYGQDVAVAHGTAVSWPVFQASGAAAE
jgi:hypothetical protein